MTSGIPTSPVAGIPTGISSQALAEQQELDRELARADALIEQRQAPSILLAGEIGTGKTTLLRTLLKPETGIKRLVYLGLEPGMHDIMGDLPKGVFCSHYLPPSEGGFDQLIAMTQNIMTMTKDAMQQSGSWNKSKYPQFMQLLQLCNNFIDERTGASLGPIWDFGADTALCLDSITALTEIANNAAIGDLPFMELRDYQIVQKMIRKFLNHLVFSTKCTFVATGHLERETDELTGMSRLMISTVGRKLPPIIPRYFSDFILTKRVEDNSGRATFSMATSSTEIKLKTRNLPWSASLPPDLSPVIVNFNNKMAKGNVSA